MFTLVVIYRRRNFVYHHWECTLNCLFSEEEDISLSETQTTPRIEQPAFKRPRSPTSEEMNKDEVNPKIIHFQYRFIGREGTLV